MPPRNIPVVVSAKRGSELSNRQAEEAKKATKQDSDSYGSDFEEEEAEKEILAKPNLNFTSKKTLTSLSKDEEPSRRETTPAARDKSEESEEEYEDNFDEDESPSPKYANNQSSNKKQFDIQSPSIEEPVIVNRKNGGESFTEDRKPEIIYVDDETRQIQKERVAYLRDYVNLEFEAFDNLLEILPSSEYGLYVSRIQNGILANSGDQTNDERSTREVQTEDEFQSDFGNQWPEDKTRNIFSSVSAREPFAKEETQSSEIEDTHKLIEFVKNVYPVVDEILTYQTKNIVSKDKQLQIPTVDETLEIPEELFSIFDDIKLSTSFAASRNQIFVSYSVSFSIKERTFPLGLTIEYLNLSPSRFFISLSEIVYLYISVNFIHALIGGTKDGSILLWDLRDSNLFHSKNIHEIVTKIKEKEADRFGEKFTYRFPNYSTDYLGENGHTSAVIKIKDIYSSKNVFEIFSLDEFGKVINWNIGIINKSDVLQSLSDPGMNFDSKVKLVKIAQFDISEYYFAIDEVKESLICSDMDIDKQGTNIFVGNQKGVAKIETIGQGKPPRTYETNSVTENGPTAIAVSALEYFFAGNRDGTIEVFSKSFSKPVALIGPFTTKAITHIIIAKYYPITLRNPNKYLEQLTKPIVFDADGNIYFFNLDQSFQPTHVENPIKNLGSPRTVKLLQVWFESNLDMHMIYSVQNKQLLHLNLNCSNLLDVTHEPIMQKQKKLSLLFKVT